MTIGFGRFLLVSILVIASSATVPYATVYAEPGDVVISNLSINNQIITDSSVISANSTLILSAKLINNNNHAQPFVAVFEIRDSSDLTVLVKLHANTLNPGGQHIARIDWVPDEPGQYSVRTFVVNNIESPEILSTVVSASFRVTSVQAVPASSSGTSSTDGKISSALLYELRNYAMSKINEDRKKFGLSPVQPSRNIAAQIHADDIIKTKQVSSWLTNGEKPYMAYTKYGGSGAISQNIEFSGSTEFSEDCKSGQVFCEKIEPFREIDLIQFEMMYEDEECCDNNHRDNILDPHHTEVSIGIAYDDYSFVIVQNFENNYIDSKKPMFVDRNYATISGSLPRGQIQSLTVYYDEEPSELTYEQNKDKTSYEPGEIVAQIVRPSDDVSEQPSDHTVMVADSWTEKGQSLKIEFSVDDLTEKRGVYTFVILFEDDDENVFPIMSYSLL